MEEKKRNWTLWIIIAAVAALLVGCGAGALLGGLAGYAAGRSAARGMRVPPVPFEREGPSVPRRLEPMPELPEGAFPMIPGMEGGALIVEVVEGSPAHEARLRVGDIIAEVDGRSLDEDYPLGEAIGGREPGDTVELLVIRPGDEGVISEQMIEVRLARHPERDDAPWLGVSYRMMSGMQFRFEMPERMPRPFEFELPSPRSG